MRSPSGHHRADRAVTVAFATAGEIVPDLGSARRFAGTDAAGDIPAARDRPCVDAGPDRLAARPGPYEADGGAGRHMPVARPSDRLPGASEADTASFEASRRPVATDPVTGAAASAAGAATRVEVENLPASRLGDALLGEAGARRLACDPVPNRLRSSR